MLASIAVLQADYAHEELVGVGFLAPLHSLVVKPSLLAAGSVLLLYLKLFQLAEDSLFLGIKESLLLLHLFLGLLSSFDPQPLKGFTPC